MLLSPYNLNRIIIEKKGLVYFNDFENLNNFIILNTNLVEIINYEIIIMKVNKT